MIRLTWFSQKYFKIEDKPALNKKIFLTRRAGAFKRHLINDQEVEESLKKEGILYFDGKQTFKEIVEAFAHASHVAGVHGSLFTNNIYGHDKTKYLEYCPRFRENHTFHHQYKLCASYDHVLVDCDKNFNIDEIDPNTNWKDTPDGADRIVHCAARPHTMKKKQKDLLNAY